MLAFGLVDGVSGVYWMVKRGKLGGHPRRNFIRRSRGLEMAWLIKEYLCSESLAPAVKGVMMVGSFGSEADPWGTIALDSGVKGGLSPTAAIENITHQVCLDRIHHARHGQCPSRPMSIMFITSILTQDSRLNDQQHQVFAYAPLTFRERRNQCNSPQLRMAW